MAHFAQIDENNIVVQVLVIEQTEVDTGNWGDPASWVQTSYNTHGGVYFTPGTGQPDPDQSKAFRKNFAGIGCMWLPDGPSGEGFVPPKLYPSWTLNSFSYLWEAPVTYPDDGLVYQWDENSLTWVLVSSEAAPQPITT